MMLSLSLFRRFLLLLLFSSSNIARVVCHASVPTSTVVELTTSNFQDILEDPANGLFLLKFFAPWCGHCKRLAPVLEEVAPQVAGLMSIGTIDCTTQKALCNEYHVKSFPTLKFYKDGNFYDYPGGRQAMDIIRFARRMSRPAIAPIESYSEALRVAAEDSDPTVAYLMYDPKIAVAEKAADEPPQQHLQLLNRLQSTLMGQVYNQVARKQQAVANFLLWSSSSDGGPPNLGESVALQKPSNDEAFVVKIEPDTDPIFWKPRDGVISSASLIQFVKETNVNLVSAFGPSNFNKIGSIGRPLVIGAVDGTNQDQVQEMIAQLTEVAKSKIALPQDEQKYYFGWMDGKVWQKFLTQFHVHGLPQIFVLHVPTKTFYQNETYSEKGIAAFLQAIDDGVLPKLHRSTDRGWKGLSDKAQFVFFRYMPYSLVAVIALVALIVLLIVPPADELRPPYRTNTPPPPNNNTEDDLTQAETETFEDETTEETKKDK